MHKDKTATQLCWRALQHFTFPANILLQDSSSFGPSKTVSFNWSSKIQWKISKLSTLSAADCYSFSKILLTLWGPCFYQNGWKTILFWIHRFFSWRKILMMWIFDLILDFSKETDPTILHKRHHNFNYLLSLNYIYHAKSLCIWETLSSQKEHLKSHACKKSSVNPQYNNIYNLTHLKF